MSRTHKRTRAFVRFVPGLPSLAPAAEASPAERQESHQLAAEIIDAIQRPPTSVELAAVEHQVARSELAHQRFAELLAAARRGALNLTEVESHGRSAFYAVVADRGADFWGEPIARLLVAPRRKSGHRDGP
jgi:hypothetical protein